MKKLILVLMGAAFGCMFFSCSEKEKKWEYRTEVVWGMPQGGWMPSDFNQRTFEIPTEEMNKLGEEGWELVSVYTRTETVHPNFGDKKYVTGLQPNTRTSGVFYVYKREKIEGRVEKKDEIPCDSLAADSVVYVDSI